MNISDLVGRAIEIAYSACRSDIECHCIPDDFGPGVKPWWNLASTENDAEKDAVTEAVEFLDGCGLLERHPTNATWVRILDLPDDPQAARIGFAENAGQVENLGRWPFTRDDGEFRFDLNGSVA